MTRNRAASVALGSSSSTCDIHSTRISTQPQPIRRTYPLIYTSISSGVCEVSKISVATSLDKRRHRHLRSCLGRSGPPLPHNSTFDHIRRTQHMVSLQKRYITSYLFIALRKSAIRKHTAYAVEPLHGQLQYPATQLRLQSIFHREDSGWLRRRGKKNSAVQTVGFQGI